MEFIVGLMLLAGVYVWVKKNYLQPDVPQTIDISPVRGVPLVKKNQNAPQDTDLAELHVEEVEDKIDVIEPVQASEVSVEVAVESVASDAAICQQIPEDSVLKRHYFAQLEAERQNLSHPYPTDSVLRRHHESAVLATLNGSLSIEANVVVEPSINEPTQPADVSISTQNIPEDSVLKRHYHQLIQRQ